MAYTQATFDRIVTGGATNMYIYKTADSRATAMGSGYFNNMIANLNVGDLILIIYDTGGTPACCICYVTSVTTNVAVTSTMYTT